MDDITTFRHMGLTRFDPGVHLVCREFLQSGQRGREIRNSMVSKRTIEVDKATAAALEARAAELGLSVSELLAEIVAAEGAFAKARKNDRIGSAVGRDQSRRANRQSRQRCPLAGYMGNTTL
jgi:hypothetical protein